MKHINSKDPRKPAIVAALRKKAQGQQLGLLAGKVTCVAETAGEFQGNVFVKDRHTRGYGVPRLTAVSKAEAL